MEYKKEYECDEFIFDYTANRYACTETLRSYFAILSHAVSAMYRCSKPKTNLAIRFVKKMYDRAIALAYENVEVVQRMLDTEDIPPVEFTMGLIEELPKLNPERSRESRKERKWVNNAMSVINKMRGRIITMDGASEHYIGVPIFKYQSN